MSKASKDEDASMQSEESEEETEHYDGTQLKKLLDVVNPVGSFATSGAFHPLALSPTIDVEGVGRLGLPLHPIMAKYVKDTVAEMAPFGRGPDTLVDESVRKTWKIEPNKVTIGGKGWNDTFVCLVRQACYELGISNENVDKLGIEAHLYKVLLYDHGGHFKPHKDTVKESGMFGTLVLQLPCSFEGGDSFVSHQGVTKQFEISRDCQSVFRYMAFYADCEHEITPVTEGWRFCLVYNLVVSKPNPNGVVPDALDVESTVKRLQIEAAKWMTSSTGKLGYCLDHEYTLDSFDFGTLKGRDAVVLSVLRNAKDDTGKRMFELSLAAFWHVLECDAYDYDVENNYGIEMIVLENGMKKRSPCKRDAIESSVWCDSVLYSSDDGFLKEFDDLSKDEKETVSDDKESTWGVDIGKSHKVSVEHHEYRGNEGGGTTTTYRSACIIFYPAAGMCLNDTIVSLCKE